MKKIVVSAILIFIILTVNFIFFYQRYQKQNYNKKLAMYQNKAIMYKEMLSDEIMKIVKSEEISIDEKIKLKEKLRRRQRIIEDALGRTHNAQHTDNDFDRLVEIVKEYESYFNDQKE